jgi:hypothetical protein
VPPRPRPGGASEGRGRPKNKAANPLGMGVGGPGGPKKDKKAKRPFVLGRGFHYRVAVFLNSTAKKRGGGVQNPHWGTPRWSEAKKEPG